MFIILEIHEVHILNLQIWWLLYEPPSLTFKYILFIYLYIYIFIYLYV